MCNPAMIGLAGAIIPSILQLSSTASANKQRKKLANEQREVAMAERREADFEVRDERRKSFKNRRNAAGGTLSRYSVGGAGVFQPRTFFS